MTDLAKLVEGVEKLSAAQLFLLAASVAEQSPEVAKTLAERALNLMELARLFPPKPKA